MAERSQFLSELKEAFQKTTRSSNAVYGFIFLGLEKLVEMEFSCPCNSTYNHWFASVFFVVPPAMIFVLMWDIDVTNLKQFVVSFLKAFCHSFVLIVTWLIIVFNDGRYLACAKTSWSGKYEVIENSPPQKWCKPENSSLGSDTETQEWYSVSQVVGASLASFLVLSWRCFHWVSAKLETSTRTETSNIPWLK